jgi:cyclopropane fatty-acyl-phospholipid synthase-like methyltransferase
LTLKNNRFANSAEAAHYLVSGKPAYLGRMSNLISGNWARILGAAAAVRKDGPVEEYDYHSMPQEELYAVLEGLYPGTVLDARRLMEHYDFSTSHRLLDIGGGSGGLALTISEANPHLKATVIDLPLVIPVTRQFIQEANAAERVEAITADAVQGTLPGSYDVIIARHLLQVLSADDIRALLSNLAIVLEPGGRIHLVGWVLDDSRLTPVKTVNYNLILLTGYADGQAYTEQEHRDWLAEAGTANKPH